MLMEKTKTKLKKKTKIIKKKKIYIGKVKKQIDAEERSKRKLLFFGKEDYQMLEGMGSGK